MAKRFIIVRPWTGSHARRYARIQVLSIDFTSSKNEATQFKDNEHTVTEVLTAFQTLFREKFEAEILL